MVRWALLGVVCLCVLAVGCGDEQQSVPNGSPKAAVLSLLDALRAGDYARACDVLSGEEARAVRLAALGNELVVPAGTSAQRRAFINRAHQQAATCEGALRLRTEELGGGLATARQQAARKAVTRPFPSGLLVLGPDQQWVVEPRDGRWVISTATLLT
jgi:hypothetical protein